MDTCSFRIRRASLPSHSIGWASVTQPHPASREAGKCSVTAFLAQSVITLSSLQVLQPCCPPVLKGTVLIFSQGFCMNFLETCRQSPSPHPGYSHSFFISESMSHFPREDFPSNFPRPTPSPRLLFATCSHRTMLISLVPLISIKKSPHLCDSFH